MSQSLTIDDIWKLFEETNRLFKESEAKFKKESEARAKEAEARAKEAEARAKEAEAKFKKESEARAKEAEAKFKKESEARAKEAEARSRELERDLQETRRILRENSAETERQMKESSAETDRKIKEVSIQIGRLGGRWGEFVEGLVAPACETMFMERGIPVHKVHPRTKASLPGNRHMEIDLLVINDTAIVAVEVKSELKVEDVRHHTDRLVEFKEFYPEYANRRIMGAVAGIVIGQGVEQFAMKQGLFVIVQSGDSVRLANDAAFQPRIW
ncbi:MAG: DUF3782 domain-containing protein [Magnetococcales bacterium]|nr:DUF3782 domain-containing protein [Magnetococcales bacterium]